MFDIMKIVGSSIRADGTIVFIWASLKSNLSYCEIQFIWGSFIEPILISCLDPYDPIVFFFYIEISFPLFDFIGLLIKFAGIMYNHNYYLSELA